MEYVVCILLFWSVVCHTHIEVFCFWGCNLSFNEYRHLKNQIRKNVYQFIVLSVLTIYASLSLSYYSITGLLEN
jgi:hypothetical protein